MEIETAVVAREIKADDQIALGTVCFTVQNVSRHVDDDIVSLRLLFGDAVAMVHIPGWFPLKVWREV